MSVPISEWPSWISQTDFQNGSKDDLMREASKVIDSLKTELSHTKAELQSSKVLHGTSHLYSAIYIRRA